jgi:hypothetical protein
MYSVDRFLTVTGHRLKNAPETIEERQEEINALFAKYLATTQTLRKAANTNRRDQQFIQDDELLAKAIAAQNGHKIKRLFEGDIAGYASRSEADLGLCRMLAFWVHDAAQLDRLFRKSGLMRSKWDSKRGPETYGALTIAKALAEGSEQYHSLEPLRVEAEPINSSNSFNSYQQRKKPELKPEALYGLPGDIVRAIDPFSEADPVALLTNILTSFGNVVGPIPYARVEETHHHLNLFIAHVGETAKGRKGTAWSIPKKMFRDVDAGWADEQITGGLSTGEGLIYVVRDERNETKPVKKGGRIVRTEVLVQGAEDKRLLLVEEEFSQVLKQMSRKGNILSPILRQAWDHGNLRSLTKKIQITQLARIFP